MGDKSISGLSCAEAASICEKKEYKEAGLIERLKLKLHLFFCKTCKNYYTRNQKLTELLKKGNIHTCSAREKESFKQKMQEENLEALKDQQH